MTFDIRKSAQFETYSTSRERGRNISESARNASVSRQTGMRWESVLKANRLAEESENGEYRGDVGPEELGRLYSEALRDSPPNTIAQIGKAYQQLKGLESATDDAALTWPATTIAYIDEEHRRLCDRVHASGEKHKCPSGSPNSEKNDFIESPEQNLQQKGGPISE